MPKVVGLHVILHIFALYICFLSFLRPVEAVVERGIAYVDNYDDALAGGLKARGVNADEYEWHRRSSGADVIEVRAEKVAEASAPIEARDQHATGEGTDGSNNDYTWGKRMERANAPEAGSNWDGKRDDIMGNVKELDDSTEWDKRRNIIGGAPGEHTDGSEWNKRGDMHATAEGPDDSHDWLKRAPQWLNSLLKRDFIWNGPEKIGPGPAKFKPRSQLHDGAPAVDEGPNDSHDWLRAKREISSPNGGHDWLHKRSNVGPFHESKPFPSSGRKLKLDKRGMIEEWLHPRAMEKRQLTCRDPGYVPCSNSPYCCPSQSNCCSLGCKNDPTDVCCNGYSCDAGYQCDQRCGGCTIAGGGCCPDGVHTCLASERCCPDGCVKEGSSCCSGGGYCPAGQQCCEDGCALEGNQCCKGGGSCGKGNICIIDPRTGNKGCCTDLKCTAWVSDGVTVPLVSTVDPEPQPAPETTQAPQTTQPPTNNQDVVVYYTYRFTITWWYWYYYYTYWAVRQVSTVTSSQETTITTVTVTDTTTETSRLFESISSSVIKDFTTPADATTALATPTIPANTAQDASTDDPTASLATITEETETPKATDEATSTTTRRRTSTTSNPVFTGGGGSGGATMVKVDWWFGYIMMGFAMGAGVGMLWL